MDEGNYSADYSVTQRIEHRADGTVGLRADQAAWEELMKDQGTPIHIFKGNFVWDMPDLHADSTAHEGRRLPRQRLAALRRVERADRRRVLDRLLATRTTAAT